jgi:hypothetical protein
MSRLMDNFDWLAQMFNLGLTAKQITDRWPQYVTGDDQTVNCEGDYRPHPTGQAVRIWLDTLRHHWMPNGGTQTGSVSCKRCGAWSMTNTPTFGCPGDTTTDGE